MKLSFLHLWQLVKTKPVLSQQQLFVTVISVFVTTLLDYCNEVYKEVSGSSVAHIQNAATRLLIRDMSRIASHFRICVGEKLGPEAGWLFSNWRGGGLYPVPSWSMHGSTSLSCYTPTKPLFSPIS